MVSGTAPTVRRALVVDVAVVLAFLMLGLMFQLGRSGGAWPYTYLSGDAANIAGFAAALDHPEVFRNDPLLGDPRRFGFYFTIHLPLTRLLYRLTGDYGTAFHLPLALHVAVQGAGFYLLGLLLWGRRDWSFVLAAANLIPSGATVGEAAFDEFWGVYVDPLPRFTFQALLPYLLAAAVRFQERPVRWPWIMAGCGALMYVHPVSAPAWAFALWIGLWLHRPPEPAGRRAGRMLALGLLFLAVSTPFAIVYLSHHEHRVTPDASLIREIMAYRLIPGYTDPGPNVLTELGLAVKRGVLPMAALGFFVAWRVGGPADRRHLRLVLSWALALVAVCGVVPVIDHTVAKLRGATPVQIDLVRGLRYLTPLCLLFGLWPVVLLDRGPARQRLLCALAAAAVLTVGIRSKGGELTRYVLAELRTLASGRLMTGQSGDPDARQIVIGLPRHVAIGERVLVIARHLSPLAVRYAALRSVAYSSKDGGALFYSDHAELKRWYRTARREEEIRGLPPKERLRAGIALARELGARWYVTEAERAQVAALDGPRVVEASGNLVLIDVTPPSLDRPR